MLGDETLCAGENMPLHQNIDEPVRSRHNCTLTLLELLGQQRRNGAEELPDQVISSEFADQSLSPLCPVVKQIATVRIS